MQKKRNPNRLKPTSLHPLTPEQALEAFMRVDRKKIMVRERKAKKGRRIP